MAKKKKEEEPVVEEPRRTTEEWLLDIGETSARFVNWGRDLIREVEATLLRADNWTPSSLADAKSMSRVVKAALKNARNMRTGWQGSQLVYRNTGNMEEAPHEVRKAAKELCQVITNRISDLEKLISRLNDHEDRLIALEEGRW